MDTITILLVLFILDGEARTFAVQTPSMAECAAMESKVPEILPKLLGQPPQFYAAKCAAVVPFLRAV